MVTHPYISANYEDKDTKLSELNHGVYQVHSRHQRWSCPPSLLSRTLNILQLPPFLIPILDTLLIQISIQNFQGIFLRNPQCPLSTPILDTLLIKISTQNLQGIFLAVEHGHPSCHGWPWPSSILSGTIIVLQVPPLRKEGSWHTSNWDRDLKFGMHD